MEAVILHLAWVLSAIAALYQLVGAAMGVVAIALMVFGRRTPPDEVEQLIYRS